MNLRNRNTRSEVVDQLPPHSLEAEQGVLGCCLMDPVTVIGLVEEATGGAPEAFYDLRHQNLWLTLQRMDARGDHIDLITLNAELGRQQKLEEVGGLAYLAALPDAVPSVANAAYYIEVLMASWRRRRLIQFAVSALATAQTDTRPETEVAESIEASLEEASTDARSSQITLPAKIVADLTVILENAQQHRNHEGLTAGSVPTGISFLDKRCAGLEPGTVFVLGAPSSTGKTAMITSIILNAAVKRGLPVTFQSMEMERKWIMLRIWCALANVNYHRIHSGFGADVEYQRLADTGVTLSKAPIYIDDACGINADTLRSRGRRLVQRFGSRLHFIDHISEVRNPWNRGDENRDATDAIYAVRAIARQTNVPVMAACQCTKEASSAARPTPAHLRASGHISQVADYIGMLHRDKDREEQSEEQDNWRGFDSEGVETERLITCHIDKQRNGPQGPVFMRLRVQPMIMEDASFKGRGTMKGNQ